jgi:hypothetical protein
MLGKCKILTLNDLQWVVTTASSLSLSGVSHSPKSSEFDTSSSTLGPGTQPTPFLQHLITPDSQTATTVFPHAVHQRSYLLHGAESLLKS